MMRIDQDQLKLIEANPIGKGLDGLRTSFGSVCDSAGVPCNLDALEQLGREDLQNLALTLLTSLQILPAARLLPSSGRGKNLVGNLSRLISAIDSDDFDLDRLKPLLKAAVINNPDTFIWDQVYSAVTESTPPPRPIASSLQQTPWLHNTSSFANSSEYRKDVDRVLRDELGVMYVGLPKFHETFFGRVAGLAAASAGVFEKCTQGSEPLFHNGWSGWPADATEKDVLNWLNGLVKNLSLFAKEYETTSTRRRRPLAQPDKPLPGSTAERKLDIGFVDDPNAGQDSRCHWSHILVPGELKSNPSADTHSKAWLDIGRYAREVLAAQDTRRFVLGFTICGSLMRVWEFDRLGGIASEQFDINDDGLQFVSVVLGFLWMNDEHLGFDPTIVTANKERFIEIQRSGAKTTERLIFDGVMQRARCIAGRATTCWKAHLEGQPDRPLVVKDSWQLPERDEEGEFLCEATDQGVVNVARYYHHEAVQVGGTNDDIRRNVRGGLDITTATNYRAQGSMPPLSTTASAASRKGRSNSRAASKKRSSSQIDAPLPPSKRSCSASPTKASGDALANRVHRRVVLRDFGKPIYEASSRSALLTALEGCIQGHESLLNAGFLHRDISINNLMINEDDGNSSWPSFLIDLDLAVRVTRKGASGAKGITGTKAFMAIGALLGEQHSFMHDLESFFWVLFWICVYYNGPGKGRAVGRFDMWNYMDTEQLAVLKRGTISDERSFLNAAQKDFSPYYQPLIPCLNDLRKVVFPNDKTWKREDPGLYTQMKNIIRRAQKDPEVMANTPI